ASERMGMRNRRRETWVSLYCDQSWLRDVGGDAAAQLLDGFAGAGVPGPPRFRLCSQVGPMSVILADIFRSSGRDAVSSLYAGAKATELLSVTLRNAAALAAASHPTVRLTRRDRQQLAQVHEILTNEFATAPGLGELARRVGLNASKLCFGFREQFGEPMSDYVRRQRLEFALGLLKTTDLQVRQVALRAGYRHHSTFTAAFARHFGVAPKHVRRIAVPLN
ncbi:MAG: helix-turn-helix transcriptional regulator, partial [Steroidobacteraceae bacterium]